MTRSTSRTGALRVTLSMALVACGDGSDGPGLAVQSDSASAVDGGQAVALHASVSGGVAIPTWTLSGPGSLSATSGTTVNYVPPDGESFDDAATVTITATSGTLSRQTTIALAAGTIAGHAWDLARPASARWSTVQYANGLFVAVGSDGGIARSSDGQTWVQVDTGGRQQWASAAYGAAGWIALGQSGDIATSVDGIAWTLGQPLTQISTSAGSTNTIVAGNGLYVASGANATFTSVDGATWRNVSGGYVSLAFGNGVFVGVATTFPSPSSELYESTDGLQ